MCSGGTDTFSILQTAHILPIGFFVAKGRPSVRLTLFQKLFQGSTDGSLKQEFACNTVVKLNGIASFDLSLVFFNVL